MEHSVMEEVKLSFLNDYIGQLYIFTSDGFIILAFITMVLLFWSKAQTLELDSELDWEPALELPLGLPGWDSEQGMA